MSVPSPPVKGTSLQSGTQSKTSRALFEDQTGVNKTLTKNYDKQMQSWMKDGDKQCSSKLAGQMLTSDQMLASNGMLTTDRLLASDRILTSDHLLNIRDWEAQPQQVTLIAPSKGIL